MIAGFENQTEPLNDYERDVLLPVIVRGLQTKLGRKKAITNAQMIVALKNAGYHSVNQPRIRKIINFIRIQGLITNLIASNNGYWIETNIDERRKYVQGVKDRAQSMLASLKNIEI
jgi:metal-dependent amidase/aminoacylase/carboxypeptidase family protein